MANATYREQEQCTIQLAANWPISDSRVKAHLGARRWIPFRPKALRRCPRSRGINRSTRRRYEAVTAPQAVAETAAIETPAPEASPAKRAIPPNGEPAIPQAKRDGERVVETSWSHDAVLVRLLRGWERTVYEDRPCIVATAQIGEKGSLPLRIFGNIDKLNASRSCKIVGSLTLHKSRKGNKESASVTMELTGHQPEPAFELLVSRDDRLRLSRGAVYASHFLAGGMIEIIKLDRAEPDQAAGKHAAT